MTHEIILFGDSGSLKLAFSDDKEVVNITGCFTLYREKRRARLDKLRQSRAERAALAILTSSDRSGVS